MRKVLIVDDNKDTPDTIEEYLAIYKELQEREQLPYTLEFIWEETIESALERFDKKIEVIDVALIDYDFSYDTKGKKGVYLVKKIRDHINQRCKIVFNTMHGISFLNKSELVDLINNDVFRFISKSGETFDLKYQEVGDKADQLIVEAIIEALDSYDPVSNALERYLVNYFDVMRDVKIDINGKEYSIQEIIDAIRLCKEPGNTFVANLLEMTVMDFLEIK
ncbi:hypothetical protein [Brevibacillus dissolubilis]|uniref:hypothetical protein n=1 Tax=Brevibacillus dissolubilis TaxID=1844116 RepID=UPI00111611DB|nr:hypothetical protein [Brevibacillus dissolubilis]